MKKLTKKWYRLRAVRQIFKHIVEGFHKKEILLVLTFGKSGSTSIYNSIKNKLDKNCFHIHALSEVGLNRQKLFHIVNENGLIPVGVRVANFVNFILKHNNKKLYIIVAVRNPIDRHLSYVFHHADKFNIPKFNNAADPNFNIAIDIVHNKFVESEVYNEFDTWIQDELLQNFNIDIYSQGYDESKGYNIYNNNKISLLLLKMENLNNVFTNAIKEFVGAKNEIKLETSNVGEDKLYNEEYKIIKNNFKIERNLLEKFTSTKYFKYFYAGEVEKLYNRWSK